MVVTKTVGFVLLICFLLVALTGGVIGFYAGMGYTLNSWVQEQSGDVKGHVATLQQLNAGEMQQAIESLEHRLDDDIIVLVPEGYSLQEQVSEEMYAALDAARKYRANNPYQSTRPGIDTMVKNVLANEPD